MPWGCKNRLKHKARKEYLTRLKYGLEYKSSSKFRYYSYLEIEIKKAGELEMTESKNKIGALINKHEEELKKLISLSKEALKDFKEAKPTQVDKKKAILDLARKKVLLIRKLIKKLKKSIEIIDYFKEIK